MISGRPEPHSPTVTCIRESGPISQILDSDDLEVGVTADSPIQVAAHSLGNAGLQRQNLRRSKEFPGLAQSCADRFFGYQTYRLGNATGAIAALCRTGSRLGPDRHSRAVTTPREARTPGGVLHFRQTRGP